MMKTETARGYLLKGVNDNKIKVQDKYLNFNESELEEGKNFP